MKNDEFDDRVRAFFAGAPRPPAPQALRRLPGSIEGSAPARERVRAGRIAPGRWQAGFGVACLIVVVAVVAVSSRIGGSTAVPGGSGPSAVVTPSAVGSPYASDSFAWQAAVGPAYSSDGFGWEEVGTGLFAGVESLQLFPIDQGLLVVGTSRTAPLHLWLSPDGFDYAPLDASAFANDDPARRLVTVNGLAKGPAGYLAVGTMEDPLVPGHVSASSSPLVWRSTDGLHWSRLDTRGLPASGVASIAAVGGGYVVALLPIQTDTSRTVQQAYFSADGASWQATSAEAVDVVGHAGHILAVNDPAIAASDDGKSWTTFTPAGHVVAVAAGPEGFVGFTYDDHTARVNLIRSADGRTWTSPVETSTDGVATGMAYAMSSWVMVGHPPRGWDTVPLDTSADGVTWQSHVIPSEVIGDAMIGERLYPIQEGFLVATQHESCCSATPAEYGPLQAHLWWVRHATASDVPGSTALPVPTPAPTPTGGISEQQAISIATARYPNPMTEPSVKLVTIGQFDPAQTFVPPDRLFWAVMIAVQTPGCSGKAPGPSPCQLPYSVKSVLVDFLSGEILEVLDTSQ